MLQKIMVAWDGSETAAQAFAEAAQLDATHGAALHVVSVAETPDYVETMGEYEGALDDARFFSRKQAALDQTAARKVDYIKEVIHGHMVIPHRRL